MDPIVLAAIIAASGTAVGIILRHILTRRSHQGQRQGPRAQGVSPQWIQAGHDVIVSGRDTHITQVGEVAFMSRTSARLVSQVADELIVDKSLRRRWSSFDAKFLDACFRRTPRGWIFDGAASQGFQRWENDAFFDLGVQIYERVCSQLGNAHQDYGNLITVTETYLTMRYILRDLDLFRHPKKGATLIDYRSLWDGSETGWCLIIPPQKSGSSPSFSQVIFNRERKGSLFVDDPELLQEIVMNMKRGGVPIFQSLEAAMGTNAENDSRASSDEDATAIIQCECGNMIVVTDIPTPLPRRLHVKCPDCGKRKELGPDDFSMFHVDE